MSDPFAHHPSSDSLESSTAMSKVTSDDLNHAGQAAARLIQAATKRKSSKIGKRGSILTPVIDLDVEQSLRKQVDSPFDENAPLQDSAGADTARGTDLESSEPIVEFVTMDDPAPLMVQAAPSDVAVEPREADVAEGVLDMPLALVDHVSQPRAEVVESDVTDDPAQLHEVTETIVSPVEIDEPRLEMSEGVDALTRFGREWAEALQANFETSVSFWTAMLRAGSPSEVLELNSEHFRRQMDVLAAQNRAFLALVRTVAVSSVTSLAGSI